MAHCSLFGDVVFFVSLCIHPVLCTICIHIVTVFEHELLLRWVVFFLGPPSFTLTNPEYRVVRTDYSGYHTTIYLTPNPSNLICY